MGIFSRILVGTDGSEAADEAVAFAARLAHEHEGELIVCHVVNRILSPAAGPPSDREPRKVGEGYIDRAKLLAKAADVVAHGRIVEGDPASRILDLARDKACTLIVVATHDRARSDRFFIGSTTEAVLRGSTIPVLTVRAGEHAARSGRCFERICVGIDDSEPSDAALATVIDFPPEDRRHVLLCGVTSPAFIVGGHEYHQAAIDELHEETERIVERALVTAGEIGRSFDVRVIDGRTAPALVAAAEEDKADVMVLGSHGRRGIRRLFIGSVAESVVQSAPMPVLVVRRLQKKAARTDTSSLATASA